MPSFRESSSAIRSSPQVTFSLTIRAMSPNLFRQRWASASRLPTPVQLEPFAMPTKESTCLDDHERCRPIEQARPKQQAQPGGVAKSAWSDPMILVSRRAAFAGTRSRRTKPPASVKSSSRTGGRPGAIPHSGETGAKITPRSQVGREHAHSASHRHFSC